MESTQIEHEESLWVQLSKAYNHFREYFTDCEDWELLDAQVNTLLSRIRTCEELLIELCEELLTEFESMGQFIR